MINVGIQEELHLDESIKNLRHNDSEFEQWVKHHLPELALSSGHLLNLRDIMCKNPCMTKDHVDLIGKLADCGELTHDNIDALCQLDL